MVVSSSASMVLRDIITSDDEDSKRHALISFNILYSRSVMQNLSVSLTLFPPTLSSARLFLDPVL